MSSLSRNRATVARVAVACALLVLAACGTTVQQESAFVVDGTPREGMLGGGGEDETGGAEAEAGADGSVGSASGSTGGAGVGPQGTATGRSGSGGPGGTQPARRGASTTSSGVKKGSLHIGIAHFQNSDQAISAAGGAGTVVDFRRAYQALVDDLNARGGLLGRKVVPHFRGFDVYGDGATQESAMCSHFTEDQKVLAVVGTFRHTDNFYSCLEKSGVAYLAAGGGAVEADERLFRDYPHAAVSGAVTLSRYVRVLVDELVAQGFLTSSSKVAAYAYDAPVFKRVIDDHLRPAMARHGIPLATQHVALVKYAQSTQDHASSSSDSILIARRFKADGIDRVIPLILPFELMAGAEGADWYPRYALSTLSSPEWLATNPSLAPPNQLKGAVGIGWSPFADVMAADDDQPRPPLDRCAAVLKAGGIEMKTTDRLWMLSAAAVCDNMWVFEAATKAGGEPVTIDSFVKGLESVGEMQLAAVPAARWGPDRHDGISAVRHLRYVENCGSRPCFRYAGSPKEAR